MTHTPFGLAQRLPLMKIVLLQDNLARRRNREQGESDANREGGTAAVRRCASGADAGDRASRPDESVAAGVGGAQHAGGVRTADADRARDGAFHRPNGDGVPARRARRSAAGRASAKSRRPSLLPGPPHREGRTDPTAGRDPARRAGREAPRTACRGGTATARRSPDANRRPLGGAESRRRVTDLSDLGLKRYIPGIARNSCTAIEAP